jgi:hypothetical protein
MTTARRTNLRSIMNVAWSFARAEPGRPFADCLRAAWKWTRGMAKAAAKFTRVFRPGVRVDFSRSLIRSPASNRYGMGTIRDRHAGASISRVSR